MTDDTTDTDQQESPASTLEPLASASVYSRIYAYLFLSLVFVIAPTVAIISGIHFGYVDPYIAPVITPDLSKPVEILAYGIAICAVFWLFVQIVRVTGIGFVRGAIRAVARLAHNYELPDGED